VLALRQLNFDAASQRFEKARDLVPQNDHIYSLLGILESNRGQSAQAIANLRKAADLNPKDLRTLYALAQEIERQGTESSDAEFQQMIQKILVLQPDTLAALLSGRVAAKRGDASTLKRRWRSPLGRAYLKSKANGISGGGTAERTCARQRGTTFCAMCCTSSRVRQSFWAQSASGEDAQPFNRFLRMEPGVQAGATSTPQLHSTHRR
jgi:tetratricopeptide (TPR) repeat protein